MASVVRDIAWGAGFLEGEGCFQVHRSSPVVTAVQKIREPLDRLQRIFGGSVYQTSKKVGVETRHYFRWSLCGSRAAACMMTIYTLMSARRKERIETALTRFRNSTVRSDVMRAYGRCPRNPDHVVRRRNGSGRLYCVQCNVNYQKET